MFAALLLPRFSLQAARRARPVPGGKPAALVEGDGPKAKIREVDPEARAEGVEPGMSPAQGLARCPRLLFLSRNRRQEEALGRLLRDSAYRCSGQVEERAPGLCLLDLRRHPKFQKESPVGPGSGADASDPTALPALFQDSGYSLQVGIGPTPEIALWAARVARPCRIVRRAEEIAGELPIEEVASDAELASLLRLWGVRTPAELAALPREGVVERLGPDGLSLWERTQGKEGGLLQPLLPEEPFEAEREWEPPIEELRPLREALRSSLCSLGERLEREGKAAGSLSLVLRPEEEAPREYSFSVPAPTAEPQKLLELLDPFLENCRTASPLAGFRLRIAPALPPWHQPAWERGTIPDPARLSATLGRLLSLMGEERVGLPLPSSDHRPEGFLLEAFDPRLRPALSAPTTPPVLGAPLRRFRPPVPAAVRQEKGRPRELQTPEGTWKIEGTAGPYPLSGRWWEEEWTRQEWDVALRGGRILRLAELPEGWRIEGEYG
ncbi:putative Nucleotidyltransferase/DNA polymerase involved in DNA repair-like protein [Methylacidimicrobium sp. AP8]|uniref:DNA polymerase Y family protein n=1 Tax=Methylacidimicrobium sp. AP8 TaxID=2730359 RepID=UPI0018C199C0|nr:DNA polymerase Y family protein [Methylacidimicrobium sp. AP8]CAB4244129.1 putative Nucleotidyltransferase/DNA polymerase involved in DNA repair-like protein [Methylacidimicrobium sp. AP8]